MEGDAMAIQIHETAAPSEADASLARESLKRISSFLTSGKSDLSIRIQDDDHLGPDIVLPASVFRLLKGILAEMAQGHGVALLPIQAELTTQQAAGLLNVSRPYLIRLLEDRKIPFRLVGQHRRVRFEDLLAFQRKDDEERRRIADELTADAQELGSGY
jgi:excisionase family DNA binding protein